jgi:hypothetical protein
MINILVCGDSHTKVFTHANNMQKEYKFVVCQVGGATAQGAVNPNSYTNALQIFRKAVITLPKLNKVAIMLGEVDCGFVIWVRSKRYNISVDEQIENSITNLFSFIYEVLIIEKGYKSEDIIVIGSVLPTIKDNTDKKYLMGVRSEVDISQKERTEKTLEYNKKLYDKCINMGYKYIDITESIFDIEKGIIKDEYLSKNEYDHHLDDEKSYKLWINKLKLIE